MFYIILFLVSKYVADDIKVKNNIRDSLKTVRIQDKRMSGERDSSEEINKLEIKPSNEIDIYEIK